MKFGDNLKKLRKSRKLSQEELAERVNVSRQSVSKWENSESYPEMNNILELCKIFHCKINDLVNDSLIDIENLGEDIRSNVVKFKKEQQTKMKALSKTISIISKICRIAVLVSIPIIFVSMIILGIACSKVEIENNEISFTHANEMIKVIEENDKILVKANNIVVADFANEKEIAYIKDIFKEHSKYAIVGYMETGFLVLIILLIMVSIMLKSLESLFNNINSGETPFTLENVGYIKKIAYLMIAVTILPNLIGVLFEVFLQMDLDIGFELFSLVEILFLFSISYIFQYGYEIQLDSNGIMYEKDENN